MPYKPGESGNPAGRPPGSSSYKTRVQTLFLELMEKQVKGKDGVDRAFVDVFLDSVVDQALKDSRSNDRRMLTERLLEADVLSQIDSHRTRSMAQDLDFARYRVRQRAFDIQQRSIDSKLKVKMKCAGRRAGKTEGNVLEAGYQAQTPDSLVLIISLSFQTCIDLYFDKLMNLFKELGLDATGSRSEGVIKLPNNSQIFFRGNSNITEREKCRGFKWDLVIIDEMQSHKELRYLIEDILEPTLLDKQGTLVLSGSGPRIRGTYWEQRWHDADKNTLQLNWDISSNPHIPNYKEVLQKEVIEKKGIDPNSPLFKREYLGQMDAFDDDALIFRLEDKNFYTDTELAEWIKRQPVTDLKIQGGLDYGWTDSDGLVFILTSETAPEKWLIHEHKANRQGVDELVTKVKEGMEVAKTFAPIEYIYTDHNEQRMTHTLADTFGLPAKKARKTNKDAAVEILQSEIRRGTFKVKRGSIFEEEALKTVWKRDEADNLTRQLDHETYHPDLIDAVIYSLREYWIWHPLDDVDMTKMNKETK